MTKPTRRTDASFSLLGRRLPRGMSTPALEDLEALRTSHPDLVHVRAGDVHIGRMLMLGERPSAKEIDQVEASIGAALPESLSGIVGRLTLYSVETDM